MTEEELPAGHYTPLAAGDASGTRCVRLSWRRDALAPAARGITRGAVTAALSPFGDVERVRVLPKRGVAYASFAVGGSGTAAAAAAAAAATAALHGRSHALVAGMELRVVRVVERTDAEAALAVAQLPSARPPPDAVAAAAVRGLRVLPGFLSAAEEAALIAALLDGPAAAAWSDGAGTARRVAQYGAPADAVAAVGAAVHAPAPPSLTPELAALAARVTVAVGDGGAYDQATVDDCQPGPGQGCVCVCVRYTATRGGVGSAHFIASCTLAVVLAVRILSLRAPLEPACTDACVWCTRRAGHRAAHGYALIV